MKHMGQDERNRIEFSLGCRMSVADIAKALGRSESTISCELLNRRIDSSKHYGNIGETSKRFLIRLEFWAWNSGLCEIAQFWQSARINPN